jgi:hypothetical protein
MSMRLRKLIGSFAILAFILLYMGVVVRLSAFVPDHGVWQAAFYIVAGISWGLPILPLISWMNRGR